MINPVIQREFFGILRSPRSMAVLLVLTIAFSLAVLVRWPSDGSVDVSGIRSLEVFRVFGYGMMAGVVFLVPAFPATSVVNEKNQGTLALLLNSPLTPLSIYAGKISGVLLFCVLVLLCSVPASAACYAMGGVDLVGDLGTLYVVLGLMALQYATLGMLVSSYVNTADAGVRITYTIVLGLFFVTLVPAAFFPGASGALAVVTQWLRNVSPLPAVMEIMGHGDVGAAGFKAASTTTQFVFAALLSSFAFAAITLSRLNYRIFDRSRSKGVITQDRGLFARTTRRLMYVVDPQRRKKGIPWFLNPVMVKEFRCRKFGRMEWLLRLVAICAVTSIVVTFAAATSATSWGVETIGGLMVLLQVILVVVLTPSLASGLISGERDGSGWDLLQLTPLSSFKLVRGKLLSVVWTLGLVLMATLPGYVMMILIQPAMWLQVNIVLVCLVWTAIQALAISAAVGSLFRSTAVSTTMTYVAVISVFVTPILAWLGRDAPFGHDVVEKFLLITPVGAALSVIGATGFENYELLPLAWWVAGVTSAVMFFVLGVQVWRLSRAV